jgi:hypothetical protein
MTRWFMDNKEGPGKDWSCVIRNLEIGSPSLLIVSCSWHPRGAKEALGRRFNTSTGRGRAKPFFTSSLMIFANMWSCFCADL